MTDKTLPKFSIGQPLLNTKFGFTVRPVGKYRGTDGAWYYRCLNWINNEYIFWEYELKTMPYLKRNVKKYMYLVEGGKAFNHRLRVYNEPPSPNTAA